MNDSSRSGVVDDRLRGRRVGGYESERSDIQRYVPAAARRILDLGCATGALGSAVKRRQDAVVVGVELTPEYAEEARRRLDRVITGDAEQFTNLPAPQEAPFDCLIAADVLEHLVDPWGTLRRAVDMLESRGTVIISVPNVAHFKGLARVVREGRWPRDDEGPFDRTHLRWFTRLDAIELVEQAGVIVEHVEPSYWVAGWRLRARRVLWKTPLGPFLAVQHIVSGRKRA